MTRRSSTAVTLSVAATILLVGCGYAPTPTAGKSLVDTTPSSSSSSVPSDTETTTTPSPTVEHLDPEEPATFDPPTYLAEDSSDISLPCAETSCSTAFDETSSVYGAYAAAYSGGRLSLYNRLTSSEIWSVELNLGSNDPNTLPEIENDSPVGRPNYKPGLDDATLAAAAPAGAPLVGVSDGRLWVLQPLAVSRRIIGSQQDEHMTAFLAVDDTGVATWLMAPDTQADPDTSGYYLDRSGWLAWYSDSDGSTESVSTFDLATGSPKAKFTTSQLDSSGLGKATVTKGRWINVVEVESGYQTKSDYVVSDLTSGKELFRSTTGDADLENFSVSGDFMLAVVPDGGSWSDAGKRLLLVALPSGQAQTLTANLPVEKCAGNDVGSFVCTGSGDSATMLGVDGASGRISWQWKQGDRDASTGVPRVVPNDYSARKGYIYARNDADRTYLMSMETGADISEQTNIYEIGDPFAHTSLQGDALRIWRYTS